MHNVRLAVIGLLLLAVAACAPASAYQARDDLKVTSGAAAAAAAAARGEAGAMGAVASEIMMDVNNIKEIERWFDEERIISFD